MTTTTVPTSTDFTETLGAISDVRRIVQADAVLCLVSGSLLVVGAQPIADVAGLEPAWPAAAAGAFLVLLGANLLFLARAAARHLLALTPWSADGDFLWAAASVAVAVGVSLTGTGRVLLIAQALLVAGVGVAKLRAVRAAR